MNLRGIGYLGLNVPDQKDWCDFAEQVLGMQRSAPSDSCADKTDDPVYLKADERVWRIALHKHHQAGLRYVGFEVLNEPSFIEAVDELEAAGLPTRTATSDELASRGVQGMVWIEDPEGIRIEIFWGPTCNGGFISPTGTTFVSDGGFGHVVFMVRDLREAMSFYTEVLGMKLTDFTTFGEDRSVQFLHCTQRHHTVALSAVGPVAGTHHLGLEVAHMDQVGAAHDRATKAGIPITATLGKHKNDLMFSFYMRSPAGFEVEIGSNPRLIDDDTWVVNEFGGGDLWGHHGLTSESLAESVAAVAASNL